MPITIENNAKQESNKYEKNHYIPCSIDGDGKASVKSYFERYIKKNEDGVLKASMRGYPLLGVPIQLPENYSFWMVTETRMKLSEDAQRSLHIAQQFSEFTYWNWDQNPSDNDVLKRAFDWVDIADALHS